MTKEELFNRLKENGLEKYFELLVPTIRNSIRLDVSATREEEIKLGQSKIGGKPDLPQGRLWEMEPIVQNKAKDAFYREWIDPQPLGFVAQLNLQELSYYDEEDLLPKTGMLYFFYNDTWGNDLKDREKYSVYYYKGDMRKLKRQDFPEELNELLQFKSCKIAFKKEISLPYYHNPLYDMFTKEERDIFEDKVLTGFRKSKVLGYSDNIQNEMEWQCELQTKGMTYNDPKAKALEANAKNWLLLLQVDSISAADMMWGDLGMLYFWIKKDDLLAKRFKKSICILQCS